jgi:hypothetical protein
MLYERHKDTTIKTFRNLGLSLNSDGSKSSGLQIRDVPNIYDGSIN